MESKEILYSYLAGFVDADGSISIKSLSKKKYAVGFITVYNCNEAVINIFRKELGAGKSRYKKTGKGKNKINWRPCWEWQLTAQKAAIAIRKIRPYLKIKDKQADLVLRLCKLKESSSGGLARWNPVRYERFQKLYIKLKDRCKKLNKRGK